MIEGIKHEIKQEKKNTVSLSSRSQHRIMRLS